MTGPTVPLGTVADRLAALRAQLPDRVIELAYHAALPVAVDPGFVHLLRLNFFDALPDRLDHEAEADLLLSTACREYGDDLYVLDPDLRDVLLLGLTDRFGERRAVRVAHLLYRYTARHPAWRANPHLVRAQQFTAWQIVDPAGAAGFLAAVAPAADPEWYVAMRERQARQAERRRGFARLLDLARVAARGQPGERAGVLRLLHELAGLPGADRVAVDRARRDAGEASVPVWPPPVALDPDALLLPRSVRTEVRAALLPDGPGEGGTSAVGALMARLWMRAGGRKPPDDPPDPAAVLQLVDELAHLSPAPTATALHAYLDTAATQHGVPRHRLHAACVSSSTVERHRRWYVIAVVRPEGSPGRLAATLWRQRGTENPQFVVAGRRYDRFEVGALVHEVIGGLPGDREADGMGLTVEVVVPAALLAEPVHQWMAPVAATHPVVLRSAEVARAVPPAEHYALWDDVLQRHGHLGEPVDVPRLGGAWRPGASPFGLRLSAASASARQTLVGRYGAARLPDAVREVRAEAYAAGRAGPDIGLLWDDPHRPLYRVVDAPDVAP